MNSNIIQVMSREQAEEILSGKKTIEFCINSKFVDRPFTAYIYEAKNSGGRGLVVGLYSCKRKIKLKYPPKFNFYNAVEQLEQYAKLGGVSVDTLIQYAMKHSGYIDAWVICEAIKFRNPRTLRWFNIKEPPENWQYLKEK